MKKDGFVSASERDLSVVLDVNLTPELIDEGYMRELVSKIQTMRKEARFEVTDHIVVSYDGSEKISDIFTRFGSAIAADTLGVRVERGAKGYVKEWDINGEPATLGVEKV
jgi:isoleucyl-tRNA synthetase